LATVSDHTAIEWSDATWNPTRGCTKVSAGCKNCYAEAFAERFRGVKGHAYEQGFDMRLVPEALNLPLRWKKPRRVFVNSMSDLFHEDVPDGFVADVFNVMKAAPRHTFQVLTKRSARMSDFVRRWTGATLPLPSVWLGVSCEDQAAADERIPHLLATPAAVRFVSCEPLLAPVDLTRIYGHVNIGGSADLCVDALAGRYAAAWSGRETRTDRPLSDLGAGRIDWVIVGGESGPKARPCRIEWIRSILAQCKAAGTAAFCKQLGSCPRSASDVFGERQEDVGGAWEHHVRDRKGGDPAEWPEDLRVREMPARSTNVAQDRRRNRR